MTDLHRGRLFGGHYDGHLVDVDPEFLTAGLRLAVPQIARVERYEFDGTVNEAGEHRFRWHAS